MVGKVCIIGGGPSGLSVLCWFAKLKREGRVIPDLVCYEKQSSWGGLWNYSWRTGSDEHGEPVHGSMYRSVSCLEISNLNIMMIDDNPP